MRFPIKLSLAIRFIITFYILFTILILPLSVEAELTNNNYGFYPKPDRGYVTDLARLLDSKEEELIEKWLWQVESRKGIEIAVVTIESIYDYPGTDNRSIESFAQGLFDQYGIGNLPKNNGILFLVARRDREARIQLGAYYGFERDKTAEQIMNRVIVPVFKKGNYNLGIIAGVKALMWDFARVYPITYVHIISIFALICFLILLAGNLFLKGKKGWGWLVIGILVSGVIGIFRITRDILGYLPKDSSDHWKSGGSGGGFGGGSSGGGGATGRW